MRNGLSMSNKTLMIARLLNKSQIPNGTIPYSSIPNSLTIKEKQNIIESILLGFEFSIYLQSNKSNEWTVLTNNEFPQTIRELCLDESFTLTDSKSFPHLNNLVFSEWPGRDHNEFSDASFHIGVMAPDVNEADKETFLQNLTLFNFRRV